MKNSILLLLLVISTATFSQNYEQDWKEVLQYELNGKTESANKAVLEIYKKAIRKDNNPQIIKCFFYISKFKQVFEENSRGKILEDLKDKIKSSSKPNQALLNTIYATLLQNYLSVEQYKINNRTNLQIQKSKDYATWTIKDFEEEIDLAYQNSIKNSDKLREVTIKEYEAIFDISPYTDNEKSSLYDYISEQYINYFNNKIQIYNVKNRDLNTILYQDALTFQNFNCKEIEDKNLKNIVTLFQENEKQYLQKNDDRLGIAVLQRYNFSSNRFGKSEQYYKAIENLEKTSTNVFLTQQLKAKRVLHCFERSEKTGISYYDKAIALTDSILKVNINPTAMAEANNIKINILSKKLSLNLKKVIYPNEEIRAFVNYKNVDSIVIKCYKIPSNFNLVNYYNQSNIQDSIVLDYVSKHFHFQKYTRKLPVKTDHFDYSTEILLEKLNVGNYLLFIETQNNEGEKLAFTYEKITVTSILPLSDTEAKDDVLFVLDRKTGKPIEGLKVTNDKKTYLGNEIGKIKIPKEKYFPSLQEIKYDSQLVFIRENDTLIDNYNRTFLYDNNDTKDDDDYDNYQAKSMVFFDRAIYRPGQKVFYKAVMVQNKDGVKSIVPNLTVHIEIEDVDGTTLKELDAKTNEFGSISGEFDIPKNGLTGEFILTIDEPENIENDKEYYNKKEEEHKFWDNVDYDSEEFTFNVEEYKRPTFEVTFNKIKENFTVGDVITISGNAKTLAGSNLSNAKVVYDISKDVYLKNGDSDDSTNYLQNEITTDGTGDFKIQFTTDEAQIVKDSISSIYFTVDITVTDSGGETKTASQRVYVGEKTLQLDIKMNRNLNVDNENSLTIVSTTLNNFPIDSKGEIEIIFLERKQFLKQRQFGVPEIKSISREEFEKLFPNEPYDETDTDVKEVAIKTIKFDTKESNEINLDFLKTLQLGQYKVIARAVDSKNNKIEIEERFTTSSVKNPDDKGSLFTVKNISKLNSDVTEIEIRSQIKDLFINARTYYGNNLTTFSQIQLVDGIGKLIAKNSKTVKENVTFYFLSVWDNQVITKTEVIRKEILEKKILLEAISMRNKIEPGSTENWSFKILDNKLEAEILASMYDSSLDQFSQKDWENVYFNDYRYNNISYPRFENQSNSRTVIDNFTFYRRYYSQFSRNPILKWFGFNFAYPNNEYYNKQYLNEITKNAKIPQNAKYVYGVVNDEVGPIPGANVIVKGTNRGTQTDVDGNFAIEAASNETLIISFIGLQSEEVKLTNSRKFVITLKNDSKNLDEVLITSAMGIKKEFFSITSNYTLNTSQGSYQQTNLNLIQSLSGFVSGLSIEEKSNGVSGNSRIVLRGNRSVTGNSEALIVIDGEIASAETLAKFAPEDIVDVSVIKGAQGAALYGSQGANGVIIVSTKKLFQDVAKVKTRTNFNETAFFYPNLKTDSDGKISFTFTTPESLTKWKLRLFAHNKKVEVGYFQSEIIAQKEVMIMPNMPRFVREKDTIVISAKVVNMTNEGKSGVAMLLLYDATTMKTIDEITLNTKNSRNFICKPKESVPVNWTITIPDGLQGLQYKIVAKSGSFSDGEENILPVLSNKILITESIPLWVREHTKKEVVFENLKNNTSSTLKNHLFTLEYTSNPVWFAIQSLPYLMEYEHECAEQTFARYYSNCIATEIINSSPKISELFESWRKEGKVKSKMEMNAELKSILLAETPWFFESDENARSKQLAVLMDLNTLKESTDKTLKKLEQKILPSGGFPWFDGGIENVFISQHILSGIGHLNKLFPKHEAKYDAIVSKGIPNLDRQFLEISKLRKDKKVYFDYNDFQFLYTRSFYLKKYPLSPELESLIKVQLEVVKKNWLHYSLYQKAMLALILNRFNEVDFAKKIVTSFKENASHNVTDGMYWIENKNGYYWYQSSVETQALLIEAFSEIDDDKKSINEMKVWLIKNKQANNWSTTKATTEAIYALMLEGTDWTSIKDNTKFKIGSEKILSKKLTEKDKEAATGYIKMNWKEEDITKEMASISVENKSDIPGYGGVYWQYFEELENVKSNTNKDLIISKELYKKVKTTEGEKLVEIANEKLKLGDLLTVKLILKTENDLEFVHLKDLRASCFEPVDVISGYKWNNLSYYMSTKDVATHFFFDTIKKGTYVLEYDVRINNLGSFNNGIATLQSMYAPEFTAHSVSGKIKISE